MKLLRSILLVSAILFMTGCAHSFVRPAPDAVKVGHSSRDEVLKLAGSPNFKNDNVKINGETIQTVTYFHVEGAKFFGMIVPQRTLTYSFFNNMLIGDEYNSSFADESTNFQDDRFSEIVKGKSTRADVIAILGKPAGVLLYPLIKNKDGKGIVYEYTVTRHAGIFSPTNRFLIIVGFDNNGVVEELSYKKNGEEQVKS
jgi:outer membrane protein assembly factor BamE (lipoprotein component of BamABCDE complex)